ncbi:MAG: hypothetical protein ABJI69_09270 [Balneola sp.]
MNESRDIQLIQFKVVTVAPATTTYHTFFIDDIDKRAQLLEKRTTLIDDTESVEYKGVHLFLNCNWKYFKHRGSDPDSSSAIDDVYDDAYNTDYDPVWLLAQFLQHTVYFVPKPWKAPDPATTEIKVILSTNDVPLPEVIDGVHKGNFQLQFKSADPVTDLSLSTIKELGFNLL